MNRHMLLEHHFCANWIPVLLDEMIQITNVNEAQIMEGSLHRSVETLLDCILYQRNSNATGRVHVDLQRKDVPGTPLTAAIERGNLSMVHMLLERGARPTGAAQDLLPLKAACEVIHEGGDSKLLEVLLGNITHPNQLITAQKQDTLVHFCLAEYPGVSKSILRHIWNRIGKICEKQADRLSDIEKLINFERLRCDGEKLPLNIACTCEKLLQDSKLGEILFRQINYLFGSKLFGGI